MSNRINYRKLNEAKVRASGAPQLPARLADRIDVLSTSEEAEAALIIEQGKAFFREHHGRIFAAAGVVAGGIRCYSRQSVGRGRAMYEACNE